MRVTLSLIYAGLSAAELVKNVRELKEIEQADEPDEHTEKSIEVGLRVLLTGMLVFSAGYQAKK